MSEDREIQMHISLPNEQVIGIEIQENVSINELINNLKENNCLPQEIDNEQFIMTNLSEGKKFDRVKTKHSVKQLGTGKIKIKIQYEVNQTSKVVFILPNNEEHPVQFNKKMTFAEIVQQLKKKKVLPKEIDSQMFILTNYSEGKKDNRVKLKTKVQQLGTGNFKVKVQYEVNQTSEVMFILPNNEELPVQLNKTMTFAEIVQQLKKQKVLPKEIDSQIFIFTNYSEGKKDNRVKLKTKVQQLGTGNFKVKVQWANSQPVKNTTAPKFKKLSFLIEGKPIQLEAEGQLNIMELIKQIKQSESISYQLIPMIANVALDTSLTVQQISQKYKNKSIELVNLKKSSKPIVQLSKPEQLIRVSITITDGVQKKQFQLEGRTLQQSFNNMKRQVYNYAKNNIQGWNQLEEQIKIYNSQGQEINPAKPFKQIYPNEKKRIILTVMRLYPGGSL